MTNLLGTEKPGAIGMDESPLRIIDAAEAMAPHLNPAAQKLLASGIETTVLSLDRGADGKAYPASPWPSWCRESPEPDRPDQEYTRENKLFVSLTKMFHSAADPLEGPWVRRFALLINKLVDAGKIDYGVVATPIVLPLAKIVGAPHRWLICLYVFSDYSRTDLNEWLGNEAFVEEGEIGTDDWEGLPDEE
jgi:hypothetical protein